MAIRPHLSSICVQILLEDRLSTTQPGNNLLAAYDYNGYVYLFSVIPTGKPGMPSARLVFCCGGSFIKAVTRMDTIAQEVLIHGQQASCLNQVLQEPWSSHSSHPWLHLLWLSALSFEAGRFRLSLMQTTRLVVARLTFAILVFKPSCRLTTW